MSDERKIDRLDKYMAIKGLNDNKITVSLGLSVGTIGKSRSEGRDISPVVVEKILNFYTDLNRVWLMTGEGEMLKSSGMSEPDEDETVRRGKVIPFFEAEAVAGNGHIMNMEPAHQTGMIEIGTELRDSQSAIRVYGNSMVPSYPAGCIIGLKLHTDSFIEPGRVYVVETRDNRYLKRLFYSRDKSCYFCLSDNQMKYEDGEMQGMPYYPGFDIPREEVIRLHRVVGVIKRNIL